MNVINLRKFGSGSSSPVSVVVFYVKPNLMRYEKTQAKEKEKNKSILEIENSFWYRVMTMTRRSVLDLNLISCS